MDNAIAETKVKQMVNYLNMKLDQFLVDQPTTQDVIPLYNKIKNLKYMNHKANATKSPYYREQALILAYYIIAKVNNPIRLQDIADTVNIPINQLKISLNRIIKELNISISTTDRLLQIEKVIVKHLRKYNEQGILSNEEFIKAVNDVDAIFSDTKTQILMCNLEVSTIITTILYAILKGKIRQQDLAYSFNTDPMVMRHKELNERINLILGKQNFAEEVTN